MGVSDKKTQTEMFDKLLVSASPHIKGNHSVPRIMWNVNLALMPLTLYSIINYGVPALITIGVSVFTAVMTEHFILLWQKKRPSISDGSAFLTGLLLALCLPPNVPWYLPMIGSFIAISVAKHMFGGLGNNVFNPALVGRAFIMASFPVAMTTWGVSGISAGHETVALGLIKLPILPNFLHLDAVTSATPLEILKHHDYKTFVSAFGGQLELYRSLLFGGKPASGLGETSAILTIIGGVYLILRGYIKWQVPVVMVGTVGLLAWIFGGKGALFTGDPVFHMMAGGLLLGAFFMATDMVTTPISIPGKMIFAAGAGALTVLIRLTGGYPEGVCYSILLMNTLTPLIDKFIVPEKFGALKNMRREAAHVKAN